MKNILLVLLCSTAFLTSAQSLKFIDYKQNNLDVSGDTVFRHFENFQDSAHKIQLKVLNTSTSALDVHVIRYELDVTLGTKNYYCWTVCYGEVPADSLPKFTDPVPFYHYVTIEKDSLSVNTVDAYHVPKGLIGLNCYRYVAYNKEDPTDSVYADICFNIGYVGVDDIEGVSTNLYPNPADATVSLEIVGLKGKGTLNIHDLNGRIVKTVAINEGLNQINVTELISGVYQCVILDSEQNTLTNKKLIINH